jgi:IMP dehydrogenase
VGGKLLGIVTTRDWDFVTDLHTPLSEVMTTDVETAEYDTITAEKAKQLLLASKRGKLPIVNGAGELLALATRALFKEDARVPQGGPASVAPDGRLLVGAAVGTRDADRERVAALRCAVLAGGCLVSACFAGCSSQGRARHRNQNLESWGCCGASSLPPASQ